MDSILITGGTGHLGQKVAHILNSTGYPTGILTSGNRPTDNYENITFYTGDLVANTGLKEAVQAADIIIHCASNPRNYQQVDIEGTNNLLKAIAGNSIKHLVYISIVGVDQTDYPYYQAKLAVENLLLNSGVPCTVVRTTQFHHFVFNMIETLVKAPGPHHAVLTIPAGLYFQSVSTQEVAELLVTTALDSAKGLLPDFGGKEVLSFEEMTAGYLKEFEINKRIQQEKTDDIRHQLFRSGVNLCPGNKRGKESWKAFLRSIHQR